MNGVLAGFHAEIRIRTSINVPGMFYKTIEGKDSVSAEQVVPS